MISRKLLVSIIATVSIGFWYAGAYNEIKCSSDPVFSQNSCAQCFDGWNKGPWSNIGFLSDDWINTSSNRMIMFKEEQTLPTMINLNQSSVEVSPIPSNNGFWEYTSELESIYSEEEQWYILPAGKKITWLKSKLWHAYSLSKNTAPDNSNVAMLIFPIKIRDISPNWTISNPYEHKECVLFKSWDPKKAETPSKLPDSWAEHVLLIILALLLAFGFMKLRRKNS